jgi:hypothetical protein
VIWNVERKAGASGTNIVLTSKESFVIGAVALPNNPYDGHTLKACIEQANRVTSMRHVKRMLIEATKVTDATAKPSKYG